MTPHRYAPPVVIPAEHGVAPAAPRAEPGPATLAKRPRQSPLSWVPGLQRTADALRRARDARRGRAAVVALLAAALLNAPAHAVEPEEMLADPAQEQRAREIGKTLRCLVCEGQAIESSGAPVARDMRLLVRERIAAGDTDAEVLAVVAREYGEQALLAPSFGRNALLWIAPGLVFLIGGGLALYTLQRNRSGRSDAAPAEPAPLDPEEEARLAAILAEAGRR